MELTYFLLWLSLINFRPDLVGTETWDDGNTVNGDGEDAYKKVLWWNDGQYWRHQEGMRQSWFGANKISY